MSLSDVRRHHQRSVSEATCPKIGPNIMMQPLSVVSLRVPGVWSPGCVTPPGSISALHMSRWQISACCLLATVKGVENLYSDRGKMLGVKGLHTNNSGLHLHKAPSFPRAKLAPHNRICMSLYCQSVKYR